MNEIFAPLVTIGLPTFNGEKYLAQTLDSLLTQDYPSLEIIISDNASTDRTREIAEEYSEKHGRVKYFRNECNIGAAGNFTRVLELASGKYFMWASDHDAWSPSLITKAVKMMENDESIVTCFGKPYWIHHDGTSSPISSSVGDTRGLSLERRFMVTLWGLTMCEQIYGVHRRSAIQQLMPWRRIFGPDNVLLAGLAGLGSFAEIEGERYYLRQLREFGDALVQLKKIGIELKSSSHLLIYLAFIKEHLAHVNRFFPFGKQRLFMKLAVLHCIMTRYGWMPRTIKELYMRQELENKKLEFPSSEADLKLVENEVMQ